MAEDSRKLFVGKLPQDIHEDEIRMIFNTYGRTTDVHLMSTTQQQPGQDRCAFVTYETAEAAKVASQVLNGVYKFREEAAEAINVGPAFRRNGKGDGKGGGKGEPPPQERGGDRFGGGKGGMDRGFDRGFERGFERGGFERGGIDRGMDRGFDRGGKGFDRGGDRGKGGYDRGGFDRGLDRGIDRGFNRGPPPVFDRGYDRGPPPRGYDRAPDRGPPPRDLPRPRDGKGSSKGTPGATKLYIGNLPADITRDSIDMVFSTYGRLLDVHIMNARAKNGQSCAFVIYASLAEARTCMAAMQQGYEIRPGEGNVFVKFADEGKGDGKGDSKGGDKGRGGGSDRFRPY